MASKCSRGENRVGMLAESRIKNFVKNIKAKILLSNFVTLLLKRIRFNYRVLFFTDDGTISVEVHF